VHGLGNITIKNHSEIDSNNIFPLCHYRYMCVMWTFLFS